MHADQLISRNASLQRFFFHSIISHGKRNNCTKGRRSSLLPAPPISDGGGGDGVESYLPYPASNDRDSRSSGRLAWLATITRHRFLYATLFPSSNYSFLAEVNFKSRPVSADTGLPRSHPRFLPSRTIIYCRPGFRLWFVVYRLYRPLFARHSLNQTWTGSAAIIGFARAVRLNVLCIKMAIKLLWIVAIHCVWIVIERLLWNTENID